MGKKTTKLTPEQEYKKELKRVQQFLNRASKRGFVWDESPIPKQPKKITEESVKRLRKITPEQLYKKAKYIVPETGEVVTGLHGRKIEKSGLNSKKGKPKTTTQIDKPHITESTNPKDTKTNTHKPKENITKTHKPKDNITDRGYVMVDDYNIEPTPPIKDEIVELDNTLTYDYKTDDYNIDMVESYESVTPEMRVDHYYPQSNEDYAGTFAQVTIWNFSQDISYFSGIQNANGVPLLKAWLDQLIKDNGLEAVSDMLQVGAENGVILTYEIAYNAENAKHYITEMMNYLPDQGNTYAEQIIEQLETLESWEEYK